MTAIGAALPGLLLLGVLVFATFAVFKLFGLNGFTVLVAGLLLFAFAMSPLGHPTWTYILSLPGRLGLHLHL